ncbi:MAG: hypothetical protein AB1331_10545 [Bacillota bacterium]
MAALPFKEPQIRLSKRMVVLIAVGVFLIILGRYFGPPARQPTSEPLPVETTQGTVEVSSLPSTTPVPSGWEQAQSLERAMAMELEKILSQMAGAGRVQVSLTLQSTPEQVHLKDTTTTLEQISERDKSGGSRETEKSTVTTSTVVARVSGGQELPTVIVVNRPRVVGVLVVADGASNPLVRAELTRAVAAYLRLATHRIRVLPRGGS